MISTSTATIEQGYVLAVLGTTLGLFIWGKWQYDIVSVLALHAVAILGIIDVCRAFAGFSYPAVITVAAILINSKTLQSGGIIGSLERPCHARSRLIAASRTTWNICGRRHARRSTPSTQFVKRRDANGRSFHHQREAVQGIASYLTAAGKKSRRFGEDAFLFAMGRRFRHKTWLPERTELPTSLLRVMRMKTIKVMDEGGSKS